MLLFRDFYEDLTIRKSESAPVTPCVSVVLPTFARAHGPLQRAIESVLKQSFGDFEMLIVDDGSRDGTEDVLAQYQQRDDRITVLRFARNSGLPALRVNQAILQSKGQFIAYQFDDDEWTEDSLAVRMKVADRIGSDAVVYGNAEVELLMPHGDVAKRTLGGAFNYGSLSNSNYIANNSVLHHRSVLDRVGLYDPHIVSRRFCDYDLWLRLGREYAFHWVDETVARVYANRRNSLARTIPLNFSRYRKYIEVDRNAALRPETIGNYDVTGTSALRGFSDRELDQLRREDIIPFVANHTDYCSDAELRTITRSRRAHRRVLITKPDYSTSIDVTIRNFAACPNSQFSYSFIAEQALGEADLDAYDAVVMYRTVSKATTELLSRRKSDKTFIYLMDDNMLRFHEVGPAHAFLAPGTPAYGEIAAQISGAHACIGYSDAITEDMLQLNRHVLRLNTNMPARFLHKAAKPHVGKVRVAIFSGPVRTEIVKRIVWPALKALFAAHSGEIDLHVWGLDPAEFEQFDQSIHWEPFTHSYDLYRNRLLKAEFDVVLVPLEGLTRADQSKSPVKFVEAIVSGAICICSDVAPYSALPDDVCIKVENEVSAWQTAIEEMLELGAEGRRALLERARRLALSQYATESQEDEFQCAFDAADLHRRLERKKILYVFHEALLGGATLHLLHHARLARSLGFDVLGLVRNGADLDIFRDRWREVSGDAELLVADWRSGYVEEQGRTYQLAPCAADEEQARQLQHLLGDHDPGLVHAATWMPVVSCLARLLDTPSVFSLHQYYPAKGSLTGGIGAIHCSSMAHGSQWAKATGAPTRRIVCPVEDEFFDCFQANAARSWRKGGPRRILVSGALQPRKNQLVAIEALSMLSGARNVSMDLIGYAHLLPDYANLCRAAIRKHGLQDRGRIHGFSSTPEQFYRNQSDILLVAATDESMPQAMLQAMAAGLIVVATDVGGVSELIRHQYTGFIAAGSDAGSLAEALSEALSMSASRRLDLLSRANTAISILARPAYVKSELVDLYNQAFEQQPERRANSRAGAKASIDSALAPALSFDPVPLPAPIPVSALLAAEPGFARVESLVPKAAPDFLRNLLALAERHRGGSVSISPSEANNLRDIALSCSHWHAVETARTIRSITLYLTNEGQRCAVKLSIAAAKRPDLCLRVVEFVLPESSSPQEITIEFEPLISQRSQPFHIDLAAQHAISIHLLQRKYTLLNLEMELGP